MAFSISPSGTVDFTAEKVALLPESSESFNDTLSAVKSACVPCCGAAADAMVKVTFVLVFARAGVGHEWSESQSTRWKDRQSTKMRSGATCRPPNLKTAHIGRIGFPIGLSLKSDSRSETIARI